MEEQNVQDSRGNIVTFKMTCGCTQAPPMLLSATRGLFLNPCYSQEPRVPLFLCPFPTLFLVLPSCQGTGDWKGTLLQEAALLWYPQTAQVTTSWVDAQ